MLLPVPHRTSRRGLRRRLILAGLAAGCAFAAASRAATPMDYLIDPWDTDANLPNSTVTAIEQTRDGYLWVGTYDGLARFDGLRFVQFDELSHDRIEGLFLDADGTLWINTYRGGLRSYRNGVFRREWPDQDAFDTHTTLVSSSSNAVVFVTQYGAVMRGVVTRTNTTWDVLTPPGGARPVFQCVDGGDQLWFLTREGRILRLSGRDFRELPDNGGLGGRRVHTLVADAHGSVWAGAENEIARWDGRQFVSMAPTNENEALDPRFLFPTREGAIWVLDGDRLRKLAGGAWVGEIAEWRGLLGNASSRAMGVHEDAAGGIWFNHYGNGVFHINPDGRTQRFTMRDGLPGDRVGTLFEGRDGGIWVGMDRAGLARLHPRRFHVVGVREGLPVRTAFSVCESPDGSMWFGTAGGGLCSWAGENVARYRVGTRASADFVFSAFPRSDGGLWLSAAEGEELFEFSNGEIKRAPWEAHGVKSMLTDRAGRLWLGTKAGMFWCDAAGRHTVGTNDSAIASAVRALAEAPDGTVWCGTDDGTLYHCETNRLQAFRPKDALADQPIWSLLADSDGTLWAGTFRGGLLRFKDGKFTRFNAKQGLPVDVVGQLLDDGNDRLWLGTHRGIYRVDKAALDACAEHRTNTVDCVTYGVFDGLPTLECSDGYQPACWRGRDGRLWFTTLRGVVSVDPGELSARSVAPPVIIEEVRVDGEKLEMGRDKLVVGPGHKEFEFRFTALNYDTPDKTRFRCRVIGLDKGWVDADPPRRTVQYWHLPPNDYRFQVTACNGDGVWSPVGAEMAFRVLPHIYETKWFLGLTGAAVVATVALGVRRAATRKYQRKLRRLEQQHAIERDRARIAKDIHDDIGAGLTQITLLSELARREPQQAAGHLDRISDSARQLTRAMDEIVWAVDPQHDTFSGLMDYASAFAEDFLRVAGIRCRMDMPTTLPEMRVDAELRYNLFLALKETLNNIVKHARATEVWLRVRVQPDGFTLVVEDNGQGLASAGNGNGNGAAKGDRLASGSGLANLDQRLAAVGGRCVVRSEPGSGTRVEMSLVLKDGTSPIVAIGPNGGNG